METIPSRIKWLRESNKLNKVEFAKRLNVNQSTISRIEDGEQKPSADTLVALSQNFGVSSDWILFGNGPPNNDEGFLDAIIDEEMKKILLKIRSNWLEGDDADQGWIKVQLRKAFPEIAEEIKKEHEEAAAADVG